MKKYIVTNGKGLRFQDQGKDFQLKNGDEFEAKPTEYMAYLLKNKFIKEVEVKVEPKAEPAKPEAKPEAKPAKAEAKETESPEAESPEAAEPKTEVKKSNKK